MATLFLVGTPIGNLGDISQRALDTLQSVDAIACEDTRHSLKLLNYFNIKKQLFACHKYNERESADKIFAMLCQGKDVALITDAGMPAISDPGAIVVDILREKGADITVVPGPTALTSAIALSGIRRQIFTFIGFLPEKNRDRDELLAQFKDVPTSLVFYCSPYDVNRDIDYLYNFLGERKLHIVREITKIHEQHISAFLSQGRQENPRGEYVVIVECADKKEVAPIGSLKEQLVRLINGGVDKKSAIKQVAKDNGVAKDEVYKIAIELDE